MKGSNKKSKRKGNTKKSKPASEASQRPSIPTDPELQSLSRLISDAITFGNKGFSQENTKPIFLRYLQCIARTDSNVRRKYFGKRFSKFFELFGKKGFGSYFLKRNNLSHILRLLKEMQKVLANEVDKNIPEDQDKPSQGLASLSEIVIEKAESKSNHYYLEQLHRTIQKVTDCIHADLIFHKDVVNMVAHVSATVIGDAVHRQGKSNETLMYHQQRIKNTRTRIAELAKRNGEGVAMATAQLMKEHDENVIDTPEDIQQREKAFEMAKIFSTQAHLNQFNKLEDYLFKNKEFRFTLEYLVNKVHFCSTRLSEFVADEEWFKSSMLESNYDDTTPRQLKDSIMWIYNNANEIKGKIKELQMSDNEELLRPGYIRKVKLKGTVRNLQTGFVWSDIPMLALVTGVNGVGKTGLLEAIMRGYHDYAKNVPDSVALFRLHNVQNGFELFSFNLEKLGVAGSVHEDLARKESDFLEEQFRKLLGYFRASMYVAPFSNELNEQEKSIFKRVTENTLKYMRENVSVEQHDYDRILQARLKSELTQEYDLHISTYGNLEKLIKYMFDHGMLKETNQFLLEQNFKYQISDEDFRPGKNTPAPRIKFYPVTKPGTRSTQYVDVGWMSPGENLELLVLLWAFMRNHIGVADVSLVFVMDEFDAHLHPGLAKEVISVIIERIVRYHNVQVIMTTHSPTTVSMVPKECVFSMVPDDRLGARIMPVKSKREAVSRLTSNFVSVNEPFRLVFTEAASDKKFYESIRARLLLADCEYSRSDSYPLLFYVPPGVKNKDGQDDASRKHVEDLIEKCVGNGNSDANLVDFMFGIVDNDNQGPSKIKNVFELKRYSIENYVFDPIGLYFWLRFMLDKSCAFFGKGKQRKTGERKKSAQEHFDYIKEKCGEAPSHQKDKVAFIRFLQTIIDAFFEIFLNELNFSLKDGRGSYKLDGKAYRKLKEANLLSDTGEIVKKTEEISFVSFPRDLVVNYPTLFLYMQGHSLAELWLEVFDCHGPNAKQQMITSIHDFYCDMTKNQNILIPRDLEILLNKLAKPIDALQYLRHPERSSVSAPASVDSSSSTKAKSQALHEPVDEEARPILKFSVDSFIDVEPLTRLIQACIDQKFPANPECKFLKVENIKKFIEDKMGNQTTTEGIVFDSVQKLQPGQTLVLPINISNAHFTLLGIRCLREPNAKDKYQAVYVDSYGDYDNTSKTIIEFCGMLNLLPECVCEKYQSSNNDCAVHVEANAEILLGLSDEQFNAQILRKTIRERELDQKKQATLRRLNFAQRSEKLDMSEIYSRVDISPRLLMFGNGAQVQQNDRSPSATPSNAK